MHSIYPGRKIAMNNSFAVRWQLAFLFHHINYQNTPDFGSQKVILNFYYVNCTDIYVYFLL
jgi:hypothetical protein